MKNKYPFLLLFLSAWLCFAGSCKKTPDAPQTEADKLPPATQTGENTFGCLVNGKAFLPSAKFSSSAYQCNYIYLNGGYYLNVAASNDSWNMYGAGVNVSTTSLAIQEGQTLKLENYNSVGTACGEYASFIGNVLYYRTTTIVSGKLYISKFDQTKQIVSGTFSFNAINLSKGDTVHVTDGRFDMIYTL